MNKYLSFTAHPASVGESYLEHLVMAVGFGLRMLWAGVACVLHGLFPFLFVTTGSDCIRGLHDEMQARRAHAARGNGPTQVIARD